MYWLGHVVRMGSERLSKQILYWESIKGEKPQHKPRKMYNDVVKGNLKTLRFDVYN